MQHHLAAHRLLPVLCLDKTALYGPILDRFLHNAPQVEGFKRFHLCLEVFELYLRYRLPSYRQLALFGNDNYIQRLNGRPIPGLTRLQCVLWKLGFFRGHRHLGH